MRELAASLGLSHSTVSRALRNDPRITPEVRRRVRLAAREHGYRRDPRLAQLMRHLRGSKQRLHQGTLALVTNWTPDDAQQESMLQEFLRPAQRRGRELGYSVEPFFAVGPADAQRLARIFRTRGITGVWSLLFGDVDYDQWAWDWDRFAFVHTGSEPRRRTVDVVDAEDRANIRLLFQSLAASGYRHIGVATTRQSEAEALYELSAGRLRFACQDPRHPAFEPCLVEAFDESGARQIAVWIKRHRVDCIVSRWRGIEPLLERIGLRIPHDIGLAYVTVHGGAGNDAPSGIRINTATLAATAIDALVAAVEQQRFGLPAAPRQILMPGVWQDGRTTR